MLYCTIRHIHGLLTLLGKAINGVDLTGLLPVPLYVTWTDKERDAVKEFREKTAKYIKPEHSDYYIGRFLIARKWDMSKSTELFINAMKWREEENIDGLVETFPDDYWFEILSEYWPTSISPTRYHYTKDGCPIMYERIGLVSPILVDYIPLRTLFLWHVYCIELMERENAKVAINNGYSPGTILCEDLSALSAGHMYGKMVNLIKTISASDEQRFPESIRKIYIVNPPKIFDMALGLLKPFLDERTLQKFANGSPKDFTKEWKEVIGEENLPKYLGGSLEWDPPCGGDVKKILDSKGIKPEKVSINRRASHTVEVDAKSGQTVYFQVMLKRSDIPLSIYSKNQDLKKVDVVAPKRYDADNSPFLLSYTAAEDGTFGLLLDNTDSPMLGRSVKVLKWVKDPFKPKNEEKKASVKKSSSKKKKESTKSPRTKSPKEEKKDGTQ